MSSAIVAMGMGRKKIEKIVHQGAPGMLKTGVYASQLAAEKIDRRSLEIS